ncbi:CPBP family intramembrane glutamic endopeptidase [Myroides odoratus]|uniref:CPBP family intramembrane glutamic endopeptidase n=1 Tax=Myroides odoratus TaxID=256 RepID=UPI00334262F1
MIKVLFEATLQVIIVIPIAFIFLKEKSILNYKRLLVFALIFVLYQYLIFLPKFNSNFDLIKNNWNWSGKFLGIIYGIIAYSLFKKYFKENNFFTIKQNIGNLKPALIGAFGIVLMSMIPWSISAKSAFNIETLAFQISLPGIDEEIIFRGILLGLLATALKERFPCSVSPAIMLTAFLFGLTHSLSLNDDYLIDFKPLYFTYTVFTGYVWGWITIKSRSILLAILSHNISNFFITVLTMI